MSFGFHAKKNGLTRKLCTAMTRAIDSFERDDLDDLADQTEIIRDLTSTHESLLCDVADALEIERFLKLFEAKLFN